MLSIALQEAVLKVIANVAVFLKIEDVEPQLEVNVARKA